MGIIKKIQGFLSTKPAQPPEPVPPAEIAPIPTPTSAPASPPESIPPAPDKTTWPNRYRFWQALFEKTEAAAELRAHGLLEKFFANEEELKGKACCHIAFYHYCTEGKALDRHMPYALDEVLSAADDGYVQRLSRETKDILLAMCAADIEHWVQTEAGGDKPDLRKGIKLATDEPWVAYLIAVHRYQAGYSLPRNMGPKPAALLEAYAPLEGITEDGRKLAVYSCVADAAKMGQILSPDKISQRYVKRSLRAIEMHLKSKPVLGVREGDTQNALKDEAMQEWAARELDLPVAVYAVKNLQTESGAEFSAELYAVIMRLQQNLALPDHPHEEGKNMGQNKTQEQATMPSGISVKAEKGATVVVQTGPGAQNALGDNARLAQANGKYAHASTGGNTTSLKELMDALQQMRSLAQAEPGLSEKAKKQLQQGLTDIEQVANEADADKHKDLLTRAVDTLDLVAERFEQGSKILAHWESLKAAVLNHWPALMVGGSSLL